MVSFKQFILEREGLSFDELISQIKQKCQPYLKEDISAPLFRGIAASKLRAGFTPHPQGRLPADSDFQLNFMFNAGIHLTYGIPSIRTRTVFATGDYGHADSFGEPAFFFPAGEFRFAWAPSIPDSHIYSDVIWDELVKNFKELSQDLYEAKFNDWKAALDQIFSKLEGVTAHEWVRGGDHVETVTNQLARINFTLKADNSKEFKPFFGLLQEALAQTFEKFYIDNKNLEGAVKSFAEILFYQTDGYYLVPINVAAEAMNETNPSTQAIYDWLLEKLKT